LTALSTRRLKTPARLIRLERSPTDFGGFTETRQAQGVIWGDFTPRPPEDIRTEGNGVRLRQYAEFICRASGLAARGDLLSIETDDWIILSVSLDAAGDTLISLERRR